MDPVSTKEKKAYFHLPGLFEFYEFYRVFLPLFYGHREYFYDWAEIGSIYGAPGDCVWGGGRTGCGDSDPRDVKAMMEEFSISARLTFSNSLLRQEHLADARCNRLCQLFQKPGQRNGIIIYSDLLLRYIEEHYPEYYFVSSTTKVITDFGEFRDELDRAEFSYVVPDFRLNPRFEDLAELTQEEKDKTEFLANECCWFQCPTRKECYQAVSRLALGEKSDHICSSPDAAEGYVFSKAMENPGFISKDAILNRYMPMGFSNFKIEGRSLGSALILEFLLYYMTKPEYQLKVREAVYLDNQLDLF
ncbi:MAG: hypothetical protein SOV71_05065 [Anaerovoracaceae bacterium]|nr:hypothetical protein [Bacillota bacterium]MDY2670908.1 hypothetical protein [Anaerovoracaceae bacterium]